MKNKKKLIYADDLKNLVNTDINRMYAFRLDGVGPLFRFLDQIDQQPAVDAVEVVHGRWLYDNGSGKYFCSACDEDALSFKKDTLYGDDLYEECLTDYCPNCGAKMY